MCLHNKFKEKKDKINLTKSKVEQKEKNCTLNEEKNRSALSQNIIFTKFELI